MTKLTIKGLQEVCDQKNIKYPPKEKGEKADDYKARLQALINGKETKAATGKSFNGEY